MEAFLAPRDKAILIWFRPRDKHPYYLIFGPRDKHPYVLCDIILYYHFFLSHVIKLLIEVNKKFITLTLFTTINPPVTREAWWWGSYISRYLFRLFTALVCKSQCVKNYTLWHTGVFCAALLCFISVYKKGPVCKFWNWQLVGVVGSFWRSQTLVQIRYFYVGISSKRLKWPKAWMKQLSQKSYSRGPT
jgi:hypothetical protein